MATKKAAKKAPAKKAAPKRAAKKAPAKKAVKRAVKKAPAKKAVKKAVKKAPATEGCEEALEASSFNNYQKNRPPKGGRFSFDRSGRETSVSGELIVVTPDRDERALDADPPDQTHR